ncbi:hypothetical protein LCGC14_0869430 [marine sediment metagenome]|uniref:Uncharacterized protein n=1 Tax=marine sediment metagenome TaxID=412755 RepID=A0A0F9PQQ2_9ZZZZ
MDNLPREISREEFLLILLNKKLVKLDPPSISIGNDFLYFCFDDDSIVTIAVVEDNEIEIWEGYYCE